MTKKKFICNNPVRGCPHEQRRDEPSESTLNDVLCDLPEELFDGWAVAKQVRESTGKEFTAENISAILDAVVILARKRLST